MTSSCQLPTRQCMPCRGRHEGPKSCLSGEPPRPRASAKRKERGFRNASLKTPNAPAMRRDEVRGAGPGPWSRDMGDRWRWESTAHGITRHTSALSGKHGGHCKPPPVSSAPPSESKPQATCCIVLLPPALRSVLKAVGVRVASNTQLGILHFQDSKSASIFPGVFS